MTTGKQLLHCLITLVFLNSLAGQEANLQDGKKSEGVMTEEKAKIVAGVMAFLQNTEFRVEASKSKADPDLIGWEHRDKIRNTYSKFIYDAGSEVLSFHSLRFTEKDFRSVDRDRSAGFARVSLTEYKVHLKTSTPAVTIMPHSEIFFDETPNMRDVQIKARVETRELSKQDDQTGDLFAALSRSLSVTPTKEDYEKLKESSFKESGDEKPDKIEFVVSQEMAPRLKAALDDLLKAHGIQVSKY